MIEDLIDGRVYEIRSRNLIVGVWRAESHDFVGVREKFGSEYLFAEFHWDQGPPFGTATAIRLLDDEVPTGVEIVEYQRNEDGDLATNPELFAFLKPISDRLHAEWRTQQDALDTERQAWMDSHPHTAEANRLRGKATLRRNTLRKYGRGTMPSGLEGLLATGKALGADRVKYHRDRMRHEEKLAVKEYQRVSDLRRGDPPA